MKNMAVLIDTNVLLNYITNREDKYLNDCIRIVELCALGKLNGYIAFHTLSTLWYVLRKKSVKERRKNLRDICTIFSVASASQTEIIDAIEKDSFVDFEDCLQEQCAVEEVADYIVTRNPDDYIESRVKVIQPDELVSLF